MNSETKATELTVHKNATWKQVLPAALVSLLVLAGLSVAFITNNQSKTCNDTTIKSASEAIDLVDRPSLEKHQSNILLQKNHAKDPNCVYILMRTAMINNNAADSRKYFTILKKLNASDYSTAYNSPVFSLKESEKIVVFMETRDRIDRREEAEIAEQQASMDAEAEKIMRKGN